MHILSASLLSGEATARTPWAVGPLMTPKNIQLCVSMDRNCSLLALKTAATLILWGYRCPHVTPQQVRCRSNRTVTSMHCVVIGGDLFHTNRAQTSQHSSCWCNLDQPLICDIVYRFMASHSHLQTFSNIAAHHRVDLRFLSFDQNVGFLASITDASLVVSSKLESKGKKPTEKTPKCDVSDTVFNFEQVIFNSLNRIFSLTVDASVMQ